MNHLQMFRYVQENCDKFDYEVRSMMKTINNSTELEKMRKDLLLLLKFTELKIQDETKYFDSNFNVGLKTLLLEHEQ
jgi:hypothetical protein